MYMYTITITTMTTRAEKHTQNVNFIAFSQCDLLKKAFFTVEKFYNFVTINTGAHIKVK